MLNFAMDGATWTAFGGSVFRILKEKYPKIIFVTNLAPGDPGQFDGGDLYNYVFWDGYYKNLYHPNPTEAKIIQRVRHEHMQTAKGIEQHLLSFLDSYFYFRNLWNWVGYRLSFTIWTEHSANLAFYPLRRYRDRHDASFEKIKEQLEKNPEIFRLGLNFFQAQVSQFVDTSQNRLQLKSGVKSDFSQRIDEAFSVNYRSNILCVIPHANPRIVSALPKESQNAYWFLIKENSAILKQQGYQALEIGKQFSKEDYVDTFHMSALGGYKMAEQVAKEIKNMAVSKG